MIYNDYWNSFKDYLLECLSDDLLAPKFRKLKAGKSVSKSFGHCYVVSEAAYHLLGGKASGWKPCRIQHEGVMHWFLKHDSGSVLDFTSDQFSTPINYKKGIGTGFLTKEPSKRAKILINKFSKSAWFSL